MKIAVTGIIGSGKSEVCNILKNLGANVFSADEINRELLLDDDYLEKLNKVFPETFVEGVFDKSVLTKLVFSDKAKLELLNSIAHPEIMKRVWERTAGENLVFCEVPLLYPEYAKGFDLVWVVVSTCSDRVTRISLRDGRSLSQAESIVKSQEDNKNIKYDDCDIIYNDGSLEDLKGIVEEKYCNLLKNLQSLS